MGMDMFVRLAKYDEKSNVYKELVLYKPGEEYHYDEKGNNEVDCADHSFCGYCNFDCAGRNELYGCMMRKARSFSEVPRFC